MNKKIVVIVGLVVALLVFTKPSYADNVGNWTKLDIKVPVHNFENGMNVKIRLVPELAFTDDAGGLKQTVFRAGPSVKLTDWFFLGANGVSSTTGVKQDMRAEIQPDFSFKLGNFALKDRNRLGYRMLDAAKTDRWQYANEYKAIYNFAKTDFSGFASHELFFDFQTEKLTQHRLTGGVGYKLNSDWTMETGYLYRTSLAAPALVKDHMVYLSFYNK